MERTAVRFLAILGLALLCSQVSQAVPAKRGLVVMRQPDGTELKVRVVGDEHSHHYLSEDGYLLVFDGDTFYYGGLDATGNITRSDIVAKPVDRRSAEAESWLRGVDMTAVNQALGRRAASAAGRRGVRNVRRGSVGLFDTGFPSMGQQKGLVVLVEYTDVKFTEDDPYSYFSRMLNEDGFSDYGGTGCAAEYFRESSMGQFLPQFDVYGPITLSNNMSYYGGNDWMGNDRNPQKMVIEACQQLDDEVDFTEYDRDGDGYIDNVFVFYAGRGEASGGSPNTVWPHSWNVTAAESTPYYFDGVRLDRYACSNEWEGSRPDGVGTFIHEFSHVMGLPDLYATDYSSAFTPGEWSVLDYGPYNNDGRTPPLYSIYERYSLGWMQPQVLDGPANITLPSIGTNEGCMVATGDDNEFFLIENRQQTGWDSYIPGHGMLVWHIDYEPYVWENNTVNNQANHQYVDLEEADGTRNEQSRAGNAFPGTEGVTSFTDDTTPSMRTWSGQRLNMPITDIAEVGGRIEFKVCGGLPLPEPAVALDATDVGSDGFTACWMPSDMAVGYELSVYTRTDNGGDKVVVSYVPGYERLALPADATEARVEGLSPATNYYYVVYVVGEYGTSEPSAEISVATGEATFRNMSPVATDATDVAADGFTANWLPLDGATGYTVDVYTKVLGEPYEALVDFTGGISAMPDGWVTSTRLTYASEAYSGKAVPALRLTSSGGNITSPVFEADVHSVSFWHRGVNASEGARVTVSSRTVAGQWEQVASIEVDNAAGGKVTLVDSLPEGTRVVRLTYETTGEGSLALDDIEVLWGGDVTDVPVGSYAAAANALSQSVTGLDASTTYYYRVTATDGEDSSMASNEIAVTTTADVNDGIATPVTAQGGITVDGRRLTVSAGADGVVVARMDGRIVYSSAASSGQVTVVLPAAGVYVVKACGRHFKVVVD